MLQFMVMKTLKTLHLLETHSLEPWIQDQDKGMLQFLMEMLKL